MALITLKTIQTTKLQRSKTWFLKQIKAGNFPAPTVIARGSGGNLFDEIAVDASIEKFKSSVAAENEVARKDLARRSRQLEEHRKKKAAEKAAAQASANRAP